MPPGWAGPWAERFLADRPKMKKTETRIQFLEQPELEQLLAAPYPDDAFLQSGRQDLNLRPPGPQPDSTGAARLRSQ